MDAVQAVFGYSSRPRCWRQQSYSWVIGQRPISIMAIGGDGDADADAVVELKMGVLPTSS